jgi:hypothetical protein
VLVVDDACIDFGVVSMARTCLSEIIIDLSRHLLVLLSKKKSATANLGTIRQE